MLNLRPALIALALAVAIAACGSSSTPAPTSSAAPTGSAAATPDPTGALVTVTLRGGDCPAPMCGQTVTIEQGGLVRIAAKPPNELGTVGPVNLVALQAAIAATDFDALRTHKVTGACVTAVDGQELVITFSTAKGDEVLAACQTKLDFTWPVLATLVTALAPIWPLPQPAS